MRWDGIDSGAATASASAACRAAAFINLVPVFAVLLGALLLDERLGAGVLGGGAAVLAGVLITHRAGRPAA